MPSLTEALFELGLGARVVGVTDWCVHPAAEVAHLPKVGGTKNPSLARVLELSPDLVIANQEENRERDVERLRAAGIPVWVTYPRTVADGVALVRELAELGAPAERAEPLIRALETALDAPAPRSPRSARASSVRSGSGPGWPLVPTPTRTNCSRCAAATTCSAIAGAPLSDRLGGEIAAARPEVILLPDEPYAFGARDVAELAALATPAAATGRIHCIDGTLISWYGPRIARAIARSVRLACGTGPAGRRGADLRIGSSAAGALPIRCTKAGPAWAPGVRPFDAPDGPTPAPLAALAAAAALCIALPALAAQVTDVRVGVHPKFTRIVFELDGRAGYQVERAGTDAAPELRITIEAMSSARELRANGDVRGVKVDAGTKARAHIALRQPGLRVHEMMLSDPPRIVIDLHKPETAVAATAKPAPKPKAAEKEPGAGSRAEGGGEGDSEARARAEGAAKEPPKPEPAPKVGREETPKPAPAPKVAAKETPKPEPAPKVAAKETPKPEPAPKAADSAARAPKAAVATADPAHPHPKESRRSRPFRRLRIPR